MTEITQRFTLDIAIDQEDVSAVEWLSSHCDLSKQTLKNVMGKGAVWLQRAPKGRDPSIFSEQISGGILNTSRKSVLSIQPIRRASNKLKTGDRLFLYYDEKVLQQEPTPPLLIEDRDSYSIWLKPAGMLAHGSKWGDHCAIGRWIEQHHTPQRTSYVVHRLDRATSGVMVIAHNKKTAAALSQQFEQRLTRKRYHAIVDGEFPKEPQTINTPIDDKQAKSSVTLLEYCSVTQSSLVDVGIETGRKHQIRRHLASIGFPVQGDPIYHPLLAADPSPKSPPKLPLRAYLLEFHCPISQTLDCFILPKHLQLSLK